ncbi:MAG: RidA family protein [Defluviitaleaceae bacterium]|nr:RidA family protein [Defluviitaleaceae bacterium]
MSVTTVATKNAPAAIGPYSQAKVHGGVLYVSGQLPMCPETGEMEQGDIKAQTRLVMNNLKAIIEAAGSSLENVLKATILLTDMADFAAMNEVYGSYFSGSPPARICYQVCALPRGAAVEIDAVCVE